MPALHVHSLPRRTAAAPVDRAGARRALRLGADVLAVAVLAAATTMLVAALLGATPRIELSDSMRPGIGAGDMLWVHRVAAREARVGDVIAFADPEARRTLLHRVRRIRPAAGGRLAFVTAGDANGGAERWTIRVDGRVGRYTGWRVPAVGRLLAGLLGLPLRALAIAAGGLLAALGLRRIWLR